MCWKIFTTSLLIGLFLFTPVFVGEASRVDELKELINKREQGLQQLEKEIDEYEEKLSETKKEANTLSTAVQQLDTTRAKLGKDIQVTETKIGSTNLNIERIEIEISETEQEINKNKEVIINTMQQLREEEQNSLIEVLLSHDSLSSFWSTLAGLESLQKSITVALGKLQESREILEVQNVEAKEYKNELSGLKTQLVDQKEVVEITRQEKDSLLKKTKNEQAEYERLLEEKRLAKEQFEQELAQYEQELTEAVNPGSIPNARGGVLSWPIREKVIITQYFGNTPFATQNPSIYSGKGHNGIDLGTPIGTPLYAAREGTIVASGNTDAVCANASYGKWILIKYDNGLTSLYAHLSLVSKGAGEQVTRDTIVGYSGNTGYSTGPHLHFTVYSSDAVRVGTLTSRVCSGAQYTIPLLSKTGGYLNPLSYLPEL